jgi:photoactive yellow protein
MPDERPAASPTATAPPDDPAAALGRIGKLFRTDDPGQIVRFARLMKEQLRRYGALRRRAEEAGYASVRDAMDELARLRQLVRHVRREQRVILEAYEPGGDGAQGLHTQGLHDLYRRLHTEMRELRDLLDVSDHAEVLAAVKELKDEAEGFRAEREQLAELQRTLDLNATPAEMTHVIEQMHEQLQALYAEKQRLSAAGFGDADEAVQMVQSMHDQLQALYAEQGPVEAEDDEAQRAADDAQIRDFLEREEMLERELGVSSPEAVVDMMRSLEAQVADRLDDDDAPATRDALDRLEAQVAEQQRRLAEQQQQLAQQEQRLAEQQDELSNLRALRRRLEDDLGTSDPEAVVRQAQAEASPSEDAASDPEAPFVPPDVLARLEAMTAAELDALDFGAVAVTDDEIVRFTNAYRPALPGLDDALDAGEDPSGAHFFRELVPAADYALFRGRFKAGVQAGTMDARFQYTFVVPGESRPPRFRIQLHRKPDEQINWILYRPVSPDA